MARNLGRAGSAVELPPATSHRSGEVIGGNYCLDHLLGQGGMGDVWLAHNQTLDIDVALKLIRPGADAEAEDRLLQEARAAARLGHPAIVRIFDFGKTEAGEPYIVMERLEGEDLATALTRHGHLTATKAVRTILPIVHALAAAHSKGIVHRDLKPENIFLVQVQGERLQPKVVDFGVAKVERSAGRLTQAGAVLGSPTYMSPEQARGEEVDHRADIWSLCVVLHELLTGEQPFVRNNYHAVLHAILESDAVALSRAGIDEPALSAILVKGLAKDPAQRWPSMRALGEALAAWLVAVGVTDDIAGAPLETTWVNRPEGAGHDVLASESPGPDVPEERVSERADVPTPRLVVPALPEQPSSTQFTGGSQRLILAVAGAMTVLGLLGGVLIETRMKASARAGEIGSVGPLQVPAPPIVPAKASRIVAPPAPALALPQETEEHAQGTIEHVDRGVPAQTTTQGTTTRPPGGGARASKPRRKNPVRPELKNPFQ